MSEGMAERSEQLALGSEILAEQGVEQVMAAGVADELAKEMAAEGAAKMASGAGDLGVAATLGEVAESLEEKASQ
jgi:hypothetical protein